MNSKTEPTRTIKVRLSTYRRLKIMAAESGETMLDLIDRLARRQEEQEMNENTRENKVEVILECLEALRRGVQPVVVREEGDGSYSYIPAAWLRDVSYAGGLDVVFPVEAAHFSGLDIDVATREELREAAEWAAETWDWETESD